MEPETSTWLCGPGHSFFGTAVGTHINGKIWAAVPAPESPPEKGDEFRIQVSILIFLELLIRSI